MKDITFVTGNAKKAEYYSKYIGIPLSHKKLDLEEIQSLDVRKVAEHKLEQAYALLQEPVIIEDGSLELEGLNGLPGPFIKFFLETLTSTGLCKLLHDSSHKAIVRSVIGYTDGVHTKIFETVSHGTITDRPMGTNGFGWDDIFIPDGYNITRAQMNPEDDEKTYKSFKPFEELKEFLKNCA